MVTRWAQNHTVNSVIGFSGTPYLDKVEKIKVVDSLSIGTAEITNIVYYYPYIYTTKENENGKDEDKIQNR